MTGYRMLSDEDIANYKRQGWEEVEIAELELYLLNNTTSGAIIQLNDAFKALGEPLLEGMIQTYYLAMAYIKDIGKRK